ncbi:MAG: hypothetical protein JXA30_06580 [Deltaproteobacteria bacterium]|nr:hypothetical protein [Deltaproteobacteria bacterium]
MRGNQRTIGVFLGSLLLCSTVGCGMRSNLDEGDKDEDEKTAEKTAAGSMDSGTKEEVGGSGRGEKPGYCGDGRLDLLTEQCDGDNLGYASCESLGQGVGVLKCSPGCYFDVSMCVTPLEPEITPPEDTTTPVGNETGYGDNPFTDIINRIRNRDAGTSDGGSLFGNRRN